MIAQENGYKEYLLIETYDNFDMDLYYRAVVKSMGYFVY
jgi:hypothetical protein